MKKNLKNIASIRYGVHFVPTASGDVKYLQTKHFDTLGRLSEVDSFLKSNDTINKNLLENGDIILPAKGNRHFAWVYKPEYGLAMASSIFFVIKVQTGIIPEYIAAILNLPQSLAHFQKLSGGNTMPSFSKKELELFEIPIPSIALQNKIAEMSAVYTQELTLLDKMKEKIIERHKKIIAEMALTGN